MSDNGRCPYFREAVVVGNGPSAIALSYLLSGNAPYYSGTSDDPLLDARLRQNPDETLLLQDLKALSEGLEGRSAKTVSLLFDSLSHPDADLGLEKPSLLSWEKREDLTIGHVVIGRDEPGGAWRRFGGGGKKDGAAASGNENNVLTVSLGSWMELPNLPMAAAPDRAVEKRVPASLVAEYYEGYVQKMGLAENFVNHGHVTSVRKIPLPKLAESKSLPVVVCADDYCSYEECDDKVKGSDLESLAIVSNGGEEEEEGGVALSETPIGRVMIEHAKQMARVGCCLKVAALTCPSSIGSGCWNPIVNPSLFNCTTLPALKTPGGLERSCSHMKPSRRRNNCLQDNEYLWEVSGYVEGRSEPRKEFCYLTRNLVLACGSDRPNSLNVPGESLPFVLHSLEELQGRIVAGELKPTDADPVMIVGAGLSAADAIIAALEHDLKIVHMFRRSAGDKNLVFNDLPSRMYPEYHKIHRMMGGGRLPGQRYQALEKQHLIEIYPDGRVKFHGESSTEIMKVSCLVVLIGTSPNLDFFKGGGNMLGILEGSPVSRNNPVDIDIYTFENVKHGGLYALGPLVGDNFVRFVQGGALAVTSHILKKRTRRS